MVYHMYTTMSQIMTTIMKELSILQIKSPDHKKILTHNKRSVLSKGIKVLIHSLTKVVQKNKSSELGLKVGSQKNLIISQIVGSTIRTMIMIQIILIVLNKKMVGGLSLTGAEELCRTAHKAVTRVDPYNSRHSMVAMKVKVLNSEEMVMNTHQMTLIKELKILILVKRSGNKKTTMNGSRPKLSS